MNADNNFVRIFGHGSSLMLILFDFFLNKSKDSNESSDILNTMFSCRIICETCNIFVLRRRIKYTKTINFDKNKLNQIISLLYDSNESINDRLIDFPNLKKLTLGYLFTQQLKKNTLPVSLTQLTFGHWFNQPFNSGDLPSSLTQLTFGNNFNQPLNSGDLPSSLTQLSFGGLFNQPLNSEVLPSSLTQLTFGSGFDQLLK